ncbi:MAG TPA: penicillin-binding protein 2 [Oceanospirillales bacterium]|nr:penicillin-binding protein 2 [Oleispira sp.]HCM04893.1 penicillin-binding protein 2 [Oceanospirillales bacterium]
MWGNSFRDRMAEQKLFRSRAIFMAVFIFALLSLLAGRMAYLQVVLHDKYQDLSENNRIQLRPVAPNRGLIYDRNGILLAENIPSYSLTLIKERVNDIDETLDYLKNLIDISERDEEQFRKRLKYSRRPYQPVVVKHKLDEKEIAQIMVNRYYLPGIDVEARLVRHYPEGETSVHALGYVGRINEREEERLDKKQYSATKHVGKLGIERRYETELHGQVGYQKVETNARGRILRVIEQEDPIPGKDLVLHLDQRLQNAAAEAMKGYRGAVVAIDVATGGILTQYSNPSYDPNSFVTGISHTEYSGLRNDPDLPLFNRAIRGQYPPASTLKPFLGLSFLDAGAVTWEDKVEDNGWYQLENDERLYRDWKRTGHGHVNLHDAMMESCDTYFYDGAFKTTVDKISPFLAQFGFGRNMALDVPNALPGLLPDREWKKNKRRRSWYAGDTLNLGIGQGFMLATPMQLATATAMLAAKGKWHTPRLMETIGGVSEVENMKKLDDIELKDPEDWDKMFKAMEDVIVGSRGTGRALRYNLNFRMAGKTGTSQVVSIAQNEEYDSETIAERNRDHALFIAFAPVENPTIAIAVIVENGESAGRTAGPVAKQVIQEYLEGAQG